MTRFFFNNANPVAGRTIRKVRTKSIIDVRNRNAKDRYDIRFSTGCPSYCIQLLHCVQYIIWTNIMDTQLDSIYTTVVLQQLFYCNNSPYRFVKSKLFHTGRLYKKYRSCEENPILNTFFMSSFAFDRN